MAKVIIDQFGTKLYLNDAGHTHREDGPAVIFNFGFRQWCIDGSYYMGIGPNGVVRWFDNRIRHRGNGPTEDRPTGYKEWYTDGDRTWPKL